MRQNVFSFTDDDLRQAAPIVRQRMLASLPAPEDCHYDISPTLKEKIRQIIIKDHRRTAIRKLRKQVAMVALCILLGISSWLAVDTEARAAFFQWVREVYEDSVIYHFFGEREPKEIQKHGITSLPQGYEETMRFEEPFMHTVFYESAEDMIILSYQIVDESTQKVFSEDEMTHEVVKLKKHTADYYVPLDSTKTSELLWIDQDSLLCFCISSYLDQSAVINLANSVLVVG